MRMQKDLFRVLLTGSLVLMIGFASPAKAGILQALDKVMRDYATGIVDQGDKAWKLMTSFFVKAPDGSTRAKEFDKYFKEYAKTFYEDGTLGGMMLTDCKALVKELLTVSNYLPGPLKAAWEALAKDIAGLKARFLSRCEKPWDDAAAEAAYAAAHGGGGGGGGTPPPAPPPAPPPSGGGKGGAGAPAPVPNLPKPKDEGGKVTKESRIAAGCPGAPDSTTNSSDSHGPEMINAYVHFLYDSTLVDQFASEVTDSQAREKVEAASQTMYSHTEKMTEQLARAVADSALQGKPSVNDLDNAARQLGPESAKYYLAGVVKKAQEILAGSGDARAEDLIGKLNATKAFMAGN